MIFLFCMCKCVQGERITHVYMYVCVDACVKTHSVVEGEERSVAMLPCLLSCCSLGEDGSESVISSISSWADWDLVFFLLNACLKELRNCKTGDTNARGAEMLISPPADPCNHITAAQKRHVLVTSHPARSGSHSVLFPSNGHCLV